MKKKIISIISIILLVTMLFACAPSVEQVEIPKEILQEYIYELAVKEGYEGAYDEWLDSIRGEAGKDGRNVELSTTPTHIVWKYEDSTEWKNLVALKDLQGTDGKSAYELAKDYGYKGTIEEWLESLKGTNGTNGTNGVDGKQIELSTNTTHIVWKYTEDTEWNNLVSLELLKGATTSITGAAGKSAYEIAVDLGYEGTVSEWIESLKGQNGHTPVITIKEGYWYVDGVSTNVKAEGKDGNGILNFELSKQDGLKDTYTITFTDNTTKEFTVTNGKDGVDGVSISNVNLTSEGNLEVTLSSGITLNLGKVKGEDGIDGTSIKEANINTDGHLILTLTDESEINVGKIVGDKGDQGLNGIGIKSIAFDSDNNLIITLTDNTEVNCGKVPTCNHIFSEWTSEIKATCTSIGVDTRECTVCEMKDYKFTEELDHKFNEWSTLISTCTEHKESRICTTCNKVELRDVEIDTNKHSYNNDICENCGNSNALAGLTFTLFEDDTYELTSCKSLATYIEIPSTYNGKPVTKIGYAAFRNCVLLYNVVIPDTIVSIESYAFDNCLNLINVTIPNSVTSIGISSFRNCTNLESITIPFVGQTLDGTKNTHFGYLFGASSYLYNADYVPTSLKEVKITNTIIINDNAFYECTSLTSIEIPNSVTSIGEYAFYNCTSFENIEVPNSVTSIESNAFYNCTGLKEIIVPNSVKSIGEGAFKKCDGLESITIPFIGKTANETSVVDRTFGYIFGYAGIGGSDYQMHKDDYKTSTEQYTFQGYTKGSGTSAYTYMYYIPKSIRKVTITNQKIIPHNAFRNCDLIETIVLPDFLETISSSTFYNCTSLTNIEIPNSVTSIESYAFYNCTGLKEIIVPNSVTSIGERAFYYCTKLTIYCEATSKPSGWNSNWNSSNCPVVWDYKNQA